MPQQPPPTEPQPLKFTTSENQAGSTSEDRFEAEAARIPEVIEADPANGASGSGAAASGAAAPHGGWPTQVLEAVFDFPTSYLAGRKGEYWRLSPLELASLAAAWKPLLDKYLPWDTFGDMGAALVLTTVILGPRLAQLKAESAQPVTPSTQTAESAA